MVNEDIVTALANAVNRGEALDMAIQVMINSGYNPREVQEAAQFVGGGAIRNLQPKADEHLTMPMDSRASLSQVRLQTQSQQPVTQPAQPRPAQVQSPQQNNSAVQFQQQYPPYVSQDSSANNQTKPPAPKKSYGMEILLLVILLILIGALVATIMFKQQILQFIGG